MGSEMCIRDSLGMSHQSSLAGKQKDPQEIRDLTSHRNNQAPDSSPTMLLNVRCHNAVGVKDERCFLARVEAVVRKRPGRLQLFSEKFDPFLLTPIRIVCPTLDASGDQ